MWIDILSIYKIFRQRAMNEANGRVVDYKWLRKQRSMVLRSMKT